MTSQTPTRSKKDEEAIFRILIWNFVNWVSIEETAHQLGRSIRSVEEGYRRLREVICNAQDARTDVLSGTIRAACFLYDPRYTGCRRIQRPTIFLLLDGDNQARVFFIAGRTRHQTTPIVLKHVAARSVLITNGSRRFTELHSLKYYLKPELVGRWGGRQITTGKPWSPADFFEVIQRELGKAKHLTDRTFQTRVQEYVFRWNAANLTSGDAYILLSKLWEEGRPAVLGRQKANRRRN